MSTAMTGTSPRWQEKGLSISFRACQLASVQAVADALDAGETAVSPQAVGHLDLAENELESIELLRPYSRLLSLDVSHNNVEQLVGLPPTLLHLNVAYNRLEGIEGIGSWGGGLLELNLSYNLLTSLQPLEQITQLQVLLAGGNRISSLIGLAGLGRLELCDARFNYVEKTSELRLLSMNTSLRTLSLGGNPVAKQPSYRPSLASILPGLLILDGQKMPRSSAQRQAAATRPTSRDNAVAAASRRHTRYAQSEAKPPPSPALTLLPQAPAASAGSNFMPGRQMLDATGLVPAVPGARRGGATAALDASLLRSQATASMQFVPQAVVGGGWQSASPYATSASKRAAASGNVSRAGNGGGGGSAGSTPRVTGCLDGAGSSAAVAAAATPRADPSPLSYGVPPPSARVQAALELGKAVAAAAKLGGRLESRQIEISQIEISADLDESVGSAADEKKLREQKLALAAAVASKEATIALNRALSRAQRGTPGPNGQTPPPTNGAVAGDAPPAAPPSTAPLSSSRASELQTPVHRAPAAFRSGAVLGGGGGRSAAAPSVSTANASSDMATLGSATNGHRAQYGANSARPANAQYSAVNAQYSAANGHRAQYSAGSARPANAQYSAANAQYVAAPSSAASVRQAAILRQAGGRTDITTDVKGLVRSYSAEALKPGLIRSKSAEAIRHGAIRLTRQVASGGLAANLSPPLLRPNSSRAAAGAATERAPASAASAERGLMEVALELGSEIRVLKGLFKPSEGPATLLESLLKL